MKQGYFANFVIVLCLGLTMGGASAVYATTKQESATFAGGCFWCMQPPFETMEGVLKTEVGYTGGHVPHPTYEQVSRKKTGHVEAIQVTYNPNRVTYQQLLEVFWRNVDPLDDKGQFCDRGSPYQSVIFYDSIQQKALAEQSVHKLKLNPKFKDIVTTIRSLETFYPAEEYHQKYYKKNPLRYKFYRYNCGRDKRLKELWCD